MKLQIKNVDADVAVESGRELAASGSAFSHSHSAHHGLLEKLLHYKKPRIRGAFAYLNRECAGHGANNP